MPYIPMEGRVAMSTGIIASNVGELNYLVTSILQKYKTKHGESYQTYNDMIGVLECAKLELYRRQVAVYEEIKKELHGDVY